MIFLQILVLLLLSGAVILTYQALAPALMKNTEQWQQQRVEKITPRLDGMWLEIPANRLLLISIFLPLTLGIIGLLLTKNFIGVVIGILLGLAIPFIVVKQMEIRRKKKFAAQLVDAIMLLSSSLKAGLSLLQSIEVLVEEMPPPVSQEFGLLLRENKMGVPLEESFAALNRRMGIEDLELVSNSILVARETGGDLPKVFSRLAITIRDRRKLQENIKTLTLQGRMQGVIMAILPFVFTWWVLTVDKHHFDIMLQTDKGRFLLVLAVVLQIVGMFLIRKFSTLKI